MGAAYPVRLPLFEGPLDLLLHLIEREELSINEVSLVAVTDQYLKAIEMLEEIEPGALADFLVVAAKLLYIKSRTLLPKPRPAEEEEDRSWCQSFLKVGLAKAVPCRRRCSFNASLMLEEVFFQVVSGPGLGHAWH